MTADYEAPRLMALDGSLGLKPPHRGRRADDAGDAAKALDRIERHGSPLMVFDGDVLKASYEGFLGAFRKHWPKTRVAYSVKTNYLSAIVGLIHHLGATVEVVSGFEYAICRRLGIPGSKIHFNGPWKRSDEIAEAFAQGSPVNLDNLDELLRTESIAAKVPGVHTVGIRVNMEVSYPPWDKFGFNLTSGDALRMARRISENDRLRLGGLHMHIGTYIPNPDQYRKGAEALVELALRIRDEVGEAPTVLDMGGGYASGNRLRGQMLPGTATSPTPEMYAECLTGPLLDAQDRHDYEPELVLEPGRALVDDCGELFSTVVAVKPLLGGGKSAIIDGGVNVLPTAYWYDHECLPVNVGDRPLENVKIFGPLCMQIDVVRPQVALPSPRPGDVYRLTRTGAYNFSQSMEFIYPRPTYLLLWEGKEYVVREAESMEACTREERIPPFLSVGSEEG